MKVFRLAFINYKRQLKDIGNIIMMFIVPMAIILGVHYLNNSGNDDSGIKVGICINDNGSYGQELADSIKLKTDLYYNKETSAIQDLEDNKFVALYVLDKDFSENIKNGVSPNIKSYKVQKGNGTNAVELTINEFIKGKIKENILIKKGVIDNPKDIKNDFISVKIEHNKGLFAEEAKMLVLLLFYFIIMASSAIAGEILDLRKEKILKRAATTSNKGVEIIGSIYLSLFLVQITYFLTSLILLSGIFKLGIKEFILGAIIIAILSLLSISLALVITRVCENPGIVNIVLVLLNAMAMFLEALTHIPSEFLDANKYIINLVKFTPLHWAFDVIDRGNAFPGILILILMTIVLFTCGNIKSNSYLTKE